MPNRKQWWELEDAKHSKKWRKLDYSIKGGPRAKQFTDDERKQAVKFNEENPGGVEVKRDDPPIASLFEWHGEHSKEYKKSLSRPLTSYKPSEQEQINRAGPFVRETHDHFRRGVRNSKTGEYEFESPKKEVSPPPKVTARYLTTN